MSRYISTRTYKEQHAHISTPLVSIYFDPGCRYKYSLYWCGHPFGERERGGRERGERGREKERGEREKGERGRGERGRRERERKERREGGSREREIERERRESLCLLESSHPPLPALQLLDPLKKSTCKNENHS